MATLSYTTKGDRAYILPALLLAHDNLNIKVLRDDDLDSGNHLLLAAANGETHINLNALRHLAGNDLPDESILSLVSSDVKVLQDCLQRLDDQLLLRSCLKGHTLGTLDVLVGGLIRGNRVAYGLVNTSFTNVKRWTDFVEVQYPWVNDVCLVLMAQSRRGPVTSTSKLDSKAASGVPIVTRFPPEPSGYLHIGHAKAALLNDSCARSVPGGKLICRFDDTNPTKEKAEFQDAILEDLKTMEIYPDQVTYSSDYFDVLYSYVESMIKSGHAYADDSEKSAIYAQRDYKLGFTPSPHRDDSNEENMSRLQAMRDGKVEGLRWSIRAKIDYKNVNGALRDPVIYRCNLTPHHRTVTTWKIYPTYDFCAPILDSIEGVTLALRSNEYRDRNAQYDWFQKTLNLRSVKIQDFSRLNFQKTVLSKRMLKQLVENGKVSGWDDPRMPTIRGLVRRGLTVSALKEFILKQGPSKNILNLEWSGLWALNRKHVDKLAPKYVAVDATRVATITLTNFDGPSEKECPCHPRYLGLGTKAVHYAKKIIIDDADAKDLKFGEEITLMNWGNAIITSISPAVAAMDCSRPRDIQARLNLSGDVRTTSKKLTWLPHPSCLAPLHATLSSYGDLLTVDKFDSATMDILDVVDKASDRHIDAFVDTSLRTCKVGDLVQFERKGYFRLDKFDDNGKARFIEIPNGKIDTSRTSASSLSDAGIAPQ